MTEDQLKDTKRLTLLIFASEHLRHARTACAFLLQQQLTPQHPLYYPMLSAVYVLYGKPFCRCYGLGQLGADIVPDAERDFHAEILLHRHKFYAHTDAQGVSFSADTPLNHARLIVTDSQIHFASTEVRSLPHTIESLIPLIDAISERIVAERNAIITRHPELKNCPFGEFSVNVRNADASMLKAEKPWMTASNSK